MEVEPSKAEPPERKRPWYQFSLRTMLIVVVIVAIPCAWFGRKLERKHREREAIDSIVKRGGTITYNYQRAPDQSFLPDAAPLGPAWLRALLGENFFSEVELLSLDPNSSDGDTEVIKEFSNLDVLFLSRTRITDVGLANINGLTKLTNLELDGTRTTDEGLANLSSLARLRVLGLRGTDVTDAGLQRLCALTRLEFLDLTNTRITDTGLANLKAMPQLKQVSLDGTRVTDAGIRDLREALPKCSIDRPVPVRALGPSKAEAAGDK